MCTNIQISTNINPIQHPIRNGYFLIELVFVTFAKLVFVLLVFAERKVKKVQHNFVVNPTCPV